MIGRLSVDDLVQGHEIFIKLTKRLLLILFFEILVIPHPLCGSFLALRLKNTVLSPCFGAFMDAEVLFGSETETEELPGRWFLFLPAFEKGFKLY
jgi:hypothetical protein